MKSDDCRFCNNGDTIVIHFLDYSNNTVKILKPYSGVFRLHWFRNDMTAGLALKPLKLLAQACPNPFTIM